MLAALQDNVPGGWFDPWPGAFLALGSPNAGEIVTAAMMNGVRDQLTDLDRRTTMVAAAVGGTGNNITETVTSSTYVDFPTVGPAVTVVIGTTGKSMVSISANLENNTAGVATAMAMASSGAYVLAADDAQAIVYTSPTAGAGWRGGMTFALFGVAPGTSTFKVMGKVIGTGAIGTFRVRRIQVTPLGS